MAELTLVLNLGLAYAALVAVASGVFHGYTGFGGALFMVPLFSLLFGPVEAIGIALAIGIFGSAQLYPRAARSAAWRELIPLITGVILFTPIGVILLFNIEAGLSRRVIGVIILTFALVLLSGWVYRGRRTLISSVFVGAVAGGINGATGVGGPALALYFLSSPVSPEIQRANIVISVAVIVAIALVSIIIAGGFTTETLLRAAFLTPAYVIGTWSGAKLFARAPKAYFRRVALWLLVATGIGTFLL